MQSWDKDCKGPAPCIYKPHTRGRKVTANLREAGVIYPHTPEENEDERETQSIYTAPGGGYGGIVHV